MQTFTGLEYLKIDIASSFGLDKEDWDVRINWTEEHDETPGQLESLAQSAEEPALYLAGVRALRNAQAGRVSGYPISLDACSSGLQILAALTGCESSAKLCGVVSTGHREDAYTNIYRAMCAAVNDVEKIGRKDTKQAIMTSLYASQAIPKQVFGEGPLLEAFYHTMETQAPGAWALNKVLQQLWQPGALTHDWVLPDGFECHIKVETTKTQFVHLFNRPSAVTFNVNQGTEEGRSISPNIVHSIDGMMVREIHRRCDFDMDQNLELCRMASRAAKNPGLYLTSMGKDRDQDRMVAKLWQLYEMSGFLSARILDYLDEENFGLVQPGLIVQLLSSMPDKPFKLMSIHDCFRVLPNYGNDLRKQYNQVLACIADSDLLSFIASQVTGQPVLVQKATQLGNQIKSADYALS